MRQLLILMATSSFLLYACGSQQDSGDASKQEPPQIDTAAMLSTGTQIAMATFGVLSAELSAAMARGGVAEAAPYCQLNALSIADSLSQLHGASIRRVTDKTRNPLDSLNATERPVFESYAQAHQKGEKLKPQLVQSGGGAYVFAPIITQEFCLSCHGVPGEDIAAADLEVIESLYPNDRATGYRAGELRGMWSLYFDEASLLFKDAEE